MQIVQISYLANLKGRRLPGCFSSQGGIFYGAIDLFGIVRTSRISRSVRRIAATLQKVRTPRR